VRERKEGKEDLSSWHDDCPDFKVKGRIKPFFNLARSFPSLS